MVKELSCAETPTPTASAREIAEQLAKILHRIRANLTNSKIVRGDRLVSDDLFTALIACISVPYVDAERK